MSIVDDLAPLVERVATTVARDYPGVDRDDVKQELFLFLLTGGKGINPAEEAGTRYILFRAAHIFARRERAAQLAGTSQYNYRPEDVRRVLETVFIDREAWLDCHVPEDAKSIKPAADPLDVVLDTRLALQELDAEDANAIAERYLVGTVPANDSAARKRLDRAITRLVQRMNAFSGTRRAVNVAGNPGSRRAMRNAHAMATLSSYTG